MEERPLLFRNIYYYRPRNYYYNINLISINSKCRDNCVHEVRIDYNNNTTNTAYLSKQEIYDLLHKCSIPDNIIEKHFRITSYNKKKSFWRCLFPCC